MKEAWRAFSGSECLPALQKYSGSACARALADLIAQGPVDIRFVERPAGHGLEQRDVFAAELDQGFRRNFRDRVLVGIAARVDPQAQEFLVETVGGGAVGKRIVIGRGQPVAAGIRGQDLVGQTTLPSRRGRTRTWCRPGSGPLRGKLAAAGEDREALFAPARPTVAGVSRPWSTISSAVIGRSWSPASPLWSG